MAGHDKLVLSLYPWKFVFIPNAVEILRGRYAPNSHQPDHASWTSTGMARRSRQQFMQRVSRHLKQGNAAMTDGHRPNVDFLPPELAGVEWILPICKTFRM